MDGFIATVFVFLSPWLTIAFIGWLLDGAPPPSPRFDVPSPPYRPIESPPYGAGASAPRQPYPKRTALETPRIHLCAPNLTRDAGHSD
jgi:hypothetical protein